METTKCLDQKNLHYCSSKTKLFKCNKDMLTVLSVFATALENLRRDGFFCTGDGLFERECGLVFICLKIIITNKPHIKVKNII